MVRVLLGFGLALKNRTATGTIANIACVSIENIKILSKVATGEITTAQAMNQMGITTV